MFYYNTRHADFHFIVRYNIDLHYVYLFLVFNLFQISCSLAFRSICLILISFVIYIIVHIVNNKHIHTGEKKKQSSEPGTWKLIKIMIHYYY